MSRFREIFNETLIEQTNQLDEGLGKTLATGLLGASLLAGGTAGIYHKLASSNPNIEIQQHKSKLDLSKYEHGGKVHHAIAKDNYGGYSYGRLQMSTRRADPNVATSTYDEFIRRLTNAAPNMAKSFELAGGWKAAHDGTERFKKLWHKLADNKKFQKLYDEIVEDILTKELYQRMNKATKTSLHQVLEWADKESAIRQVILSFANQHGQNKAFDMMQLAIQNVHPNNPKDFVKELYRIRMNRYKAYRNRYVNEVKDVLAEL